MAEVRKTEEDALFEVVDREAADDVERNASRILYQALQDRKETLGGQAQIPLDDKHLSEVIFAEARQRSAQITGLANGAVSDRLDPPARAIPVWLIIAWIVAIALVVTAFLVLNK